MLAIIDADSYIYVGCSKAEKDGVNSAQNYVDKVITQAINDTEATSYICVIGKESFRRNKLSGVKSIYKAQRGNKPSYYEEMFEYIRERWNAYEAKVIETDDVCSVLQYELRHLDPIVISPDKDLRQYSGKFYDSKKRLFEELSFKQANYNFWKQMLTGDVADNVKGISGIGQKKAANILDNSFPSEVFDVYVNHFGEEAVNIFWSNMYYLSLLRSYTQADDYGVNLREIKPQEWTYLAK